MNDGEPRRPARRPRRMMYVSIAILLGAGALAGAAAIGWWGRDYRDPLAGAVHTSVSGSGMVSGLIPVALLAVAGLGAIAASRGILRRIIGTLIALAGIGVAVWTTLVAADAPVDLLQAALKRPATPTGGASLSIVGPALALAGAVLVAGAGIAVLVARTTGRAVGTMGAAYDSPSQRRARARTRPAPGDDPGQLWRALDAGIDPTDEPGRDAAAAADTIGTPDEAAAAADVEPSHDEETTR